MIYRKLLLKAALLVFPFISLAQEPEQDCINAITVCQNTMAYTTMASGSGSIPDEINNQNSCLGAGELNSVWFKVYIVQDGVLGFNLVPISTTDDYDWAVFNLTTASCSDIYTNYELEVACNFSGSTFPNGTTGPNSGPNPQDEPLINVSAGEVYYIVVSSFSSSVSGFTLDFSPSNSIGNGANVGFNQYLTPSSCNSNQFDVWFNQPVYCYSLQLSDFTLYDSNNQQIPLLSFDAPCDNALDNVTGVVLTTGQNLQQGAQYKLVINGEVVSICGNVATVYDEAYFTLPVGNFAVLGYDLVQDTCFNSAEVTPLIAYPGQSLSYQWVFPDGQTSSDNTITAFADGDYSLTVTSYTGCTATYTGYIDVLNTYAGPLQYQYSNDTLYALPAGLNQYQWFLYSSGTPQSYITYAPVNYIVLSNFTIILPMLVQVYAEGEYGCELTSTYDLLGVEELTNNKAFTINTITADRVVLTSTQNLNGTISLYTMAGVLLQSPGVSNTNNIQLDISQYPPGFYILTYTNTKGQTYSAKIAKVDN